MSARPLRLSKPERGRPDDVRHLPVNRPSPHRLGPTKPYHRLLGTPARPSIIPHICCAPRSPNARVRDEGPTRSRCDHPRARWALRNRTAGIRNAFPSPRSPPPLPAGPLESGTRALSVIAPPIDHPRARWTPRSPTADAWEPPPTPSMSPHPAPLESRTPAFGMTSAPIDHPRARWAPRSPTTGD
ncbi:hypothetical protein B0H13DRAFT_2380119 [Mycena leptocephala]|nr:hypothetical protein B0H13DRAFT_2380119 [Mycena leptocephala]